MSSIVNKIKDAVHSDDRNTGTTGSNTGSTTTGRSGLGAGFGSGPAPNTVGPHNSDTMNKLDPRVDSDRGAHGGFTGTGSTTGTAGTADSRLGTGGAREGEFGPHGSRLANTLDPRVDSDRDGSRTMNPGIGTGPAANTAGPHRSDRMNKLDPRVDSDLDGSNTLGANRSFQSDAAGVRDPRDAAQVPPSVMRQHIGDPTIAHGDVAHDRERRNSKISDQDAFRGI